MGTDYRPWRSRESARAGKHYTEGRFREESPAGPVQERGLLHLPGPAVEAAAMTILRADMHVHTCFSRYNDNIAFLGARDCYSTPQQVYATAKARGMDLVAITDHDSIDGALALVDATHNAPDVIVGEEVSCWYPDGPF